jgi:hypothetical protein
VSKSGSWARGLDPRGTGYDVEVGSRDGPRERDLVLSVLTRPTVRSGYKNRTIYLSIYMLPSRPRFCYLKTSAAGRLAEEHGVVKSGQEITGDAAFSWQLERVLAGVWRHVGWH